MIEILDFLKEYNYLTDSDILQTKFDLYSNSVIFKILQFKGEDINGITKYTEAYYFEVIFKRVKNFTFNYEIIEHNEYDLTRAPYFKLWGLEVKKIDDNLIEVDMDICDREMIIKCEDVAFILLDREKTNL